MKINMKMGRVMHRSLNHDSGILDSSMHPICRI